MNLNEIQDDIEAQMTGVRAYSGIEQSLEAECEHDAWAATCAECHARHHAEIIALKAEISRLETARDEVAVLRKVAVGLMSRWDYSDSRRIVWCINCGLQVQAFGRMGGHADGCPRLLYGGLLLRSAGGLWV